MTNGIHSKLVTVNPITIAMAKKFRQRTGSAPIDSLETRVTESAEHHPGKKDEQRGETHFAGAQLVFTREPDHEEGQRSDEPGGGRNGKPRNSLLAAVLLAAARQLKRARRSAPPGREPR